MYELDKFPSKWVDVVHCSKHHEYSKRDCAQVCFSHSPYMTDENKEWNGMAELCPKESASLELLLPHKLYTYDDKLYMQLHESGHWFVLSCPYLWADCSSCDGETSSSYDVNEFLDLRDIIYNGMGNSERNEIMSCMNPYSEDEDPMPLGNESFEAYRERVSEEYLYSTVFL